MFYDTKYYIGAYIKIYLTEIVNGSLLTRITGNGLYFIGTFVLYGPCRNSGSKTVREFLSLKCVVDHEVHKDFQKFHRKTQ